VSTSKVFEGFVGQEVLSDSVIDSHRKAVILEHEGIIGQLSELGLWGTKRVAHDRIRRGGRRGPRSLCARVEVLLARREKSACQATSRGRDGLVPQTDVLFHEGDDRLGGKFANKGAQPLHILGGKKETSHGGLSRAVFHILERVKPLQCGRRRRRDPICLVGRHRLLRLWWWDVEVVPERGWVALCARVLVRIHQEQSTVHPKGGLHPLKQRLGPE